MRKTDYKLRFQYSLKAENGTSYGAGSAIVPYSWELAKAGSSYVVVIITLFRRLMI